ncbi:MAG: class I SAM-dependent methyltransferase [Rhodothalassiaceae bacterium]
MSSKQTVDFGYTEVSDREKPRLVGSVFSSVARRYDLMNDVMSGGLHRLWKDAMIDWVRPRAGERILDVAGGTGDIAFRMARASGFGADILVSDINEDMLSEGRRRAHHRRVPNLRWCLADAEALPLPDRSLDAYTIAFGIRNVTHRERALAEAHRVLRPGGRFVCMEFSRPAVPALDRLYDLYSFRLIPFLGRWVAGDAESYRYLVESIRRFPDPDSFSGMIRAAGLSRVRVRCMTGGIVALHAARRL